LHAGRKVDEEQKKAKKRAQTPVVGDLEPLLSALSTIKIPEINRDQKKANNR